MASADAERIADALDGVGHAIRRGMAAHVALSLTPPDGSFADWQENFDQVLEVVNGKAGAQNLGGRPRSTPLGEPWPPEQ